VICKYVLDKEHDTASEFTMSNSKLAAENIKNIHWDIGPSIEDLPVLAKCRRLRKLALFLDGRDFPSSEVLCDFIMRMKHLRHLRLVHNSNLEVNSLRDKINEFVLPRRPNFDLCLCTDNDDM
jgi:hypothetical protein